MASDSKSQIIRPSLEISKKLLINLFSKQSECSYVSCYCEENVYKLAQDVIGRHPNEISKCYVVFISNSSRTVPLWRQRAGKDEDKLVIWDYHVIFLYHPEPEKCLVYDLDSELPFPTYVHKYITETFRTDHILKPDYFSTLSNSVTFSDKFVKCGMDGFRLICLNEILRNILGVPFKRNTDVIIPSKWFTTYFRIIPANEFLKEFASDRRHMKRSDGTWIKPPPNYPAIQTTTNDHNLEDYIQMDTSKGPGQVLNLTQFVQRFYKPAT